MIEDVKRIKSNKGVNLGGLLEVGNSVNQIGIQPICS